MMKKSLDTIVIDALFENKRINVDDLPVESEHTCTFCGNEQIHYIKYFGNDKVAYECQKCKILRNVDLDIYKRKV